MLEKITVLGTFKAEGNMIIGGKTFYKGTTQEIEIDEDTYVNLKRADENGWFKIKSDNFNEFLVSRGREPIQSVEPSKKEVVTLVVPEVKVEEPKVEEVKIEEVKVEEVKVEAPQKPLSRSEKRKKALEMIKEEAKVEEPAIEEPKVEEPKVEEPTIEEPSEV